MSLRNVSLKDVSRAIDTLSNKNETVSLRAIRAEIGHGSLTTISKYLKEWRALNNYTANKTAVSTPGNEPINCISRAYLAVSNSDIATPGDTPIDTVTVKDNLIHFPKSSNHDYRITSKEKDLRSVSSMPEKQTDTPGPTDTPTDTVSTISIIDTPGLTDTPTDTVSTISIIDTPGPTDTPTDTVHAEQSEIPPKHEYRLANREEDSFAKKNSLSLCEQWIDSLKEAFTPKNVSSTIRISVNSIIRETIYGGKLLVIVALIVSALWLSTEVSGEYFGNKGSTIALGLIFAGGIMSFLAATSKTVLKGLFFRCIAYTGTAAFLLVVFAGIKDTSLKESEEYKIKTKSIQNLEDQIQQILTTIATLPPDFAKVREKEYARQEALQTELKTAQNELLKLKPSASTNYTVYGQFIARFVLDVLIFALFEMLALILIRRKDLE